MSNVSRRQITVVFCDLVDSTRLAQRLDPEELYDLLRAYRELVQRTVAPFKGHVARSTGDGIDVYFGYPVADEHDAVQAVHAGLAIVEEVERCNAQGELQVPIAVRIGIATGWLAIDLQDPSGTAGATLNLAARIQAVVEPGVVAIAPSTQRVAGAQFLYEPLGSFDLKGFDKPVEISAVRRALSLGSRSEWRWRNARNPFIGREKEIAQLETAWSNADETHPFAVLLSAEPGMGKSRLAHELASRVTQSGAAVVNLQCSPFHSNSPLHPFVEYLRQTAGCGAQETAQEQWRKLSASLGAAGIDDALDRQLLAQLMGLAGDGHAPPIELPPPVQQKRMQAALMRYVAASSRSDQDAAWLLLCEDLHWIDPSSLELLQGLWSAERDRGMRLLFTARPQFTQRRIGADEFEVMNLARLEPEASLRLVRHHLGGEQVDATVAATINTIVAKTDGVPLYIEELARMVRDQHDENEMLGRGLPAIPDTLRDLLMERLDRVGAGKWLAQVASVVGVHGTLETLKKLAQLEDTEFRASADALLESGLMIETAMMSGVLVFKHALLEDTAYASIPLKLRASLHGKVAALLAPEEGIEGQLEIVARHLSRAGEHLKAASMCLPAAQHMLSHGAPREAEAQLRAGIDSLDRLPGASDHERDRVRLALLSVLGPTMMVLQGPGSRSFGEIQQEAHRLCLHMANTEDVDTQRFPITYGLALYHWGRAELSRARELAAELGVLALGRHSPGLVMATKNMSGMVRLHQGHVGEARQHLEEVVALYEPSRDRALYPVYLMDFGVFGRFYLALSAWIGGDADAARRRAEEAYELAPTLDQPHSVGFSMLANMLVANFAGDVDSALDWANRCAEYSMKFGFPEFVAMAHVVRGWTAVRKGDCDTGLAEIEAGIEEWRATGFENWQTWFGSLKAEALSTIGRHEDALSEIAFQLRRSRANGETLFRGVLLADQACALRSLSRDRAEVARAFAAAERLCVRQKANAWLQRIDRQQRIVPAACA